MMKLMKDKTGAKSNQEIKNAVGKLSDELKMLNDEDLDQVAGGTITVMCSMDYCTYSVMRNRCVCNFD